jgi:hypothetical protein
MILMSLLFKSYAFVVMAFQAAREKGNDRNGGTN